MRPIATTILSLLILFGLQNAPLAEPGALNRDAEAILVSGNQLAPLLGLPLEQLFLYRFQDGYWHQIPWQFDEVADGWIVGTEDGVLDEDDQLLFMAEDTGQFAPPTFWVDDASARSFPRVVLEVIDPLQTNQKGWVYLYRSNTLGQMATSDYVNASLQGGRVNLQSTTYQLGIPSDRFVADQFTLFGAGTDILDLIKVRVHAPLLGEIKLEELEANIPFTIIRDGKIRAFIAIRQDEEPFQVSVAAYRGHFIYDLDLDLSEQLPPGLNLNWARVSTDLSSEARGSRYYDQNTSAGVLIDGNPEPVAAQPPSAWIEVSGNTGTTVQITDVSALGGTVTTYYKDDARLDTKDSGDQRSYGDAGLRVDSPNLQVDTTSTVYVLPPRQGNVGEGYWQLHNNPLQTTTRSQTFRPLSGPPHYFPLIQLGS